VKAHLARLGVNFAVGGLSDSQSAHELMRNSLGPAKVKYALRTLPLRHTAAFSQLVTVTQRATRNAVVGASVSAAAWVDASLPFSEGGCSVASAFDWPRWRG